MSDPLKQNGFIVAAPSSGSGKTVITLALLRAFRNRNLSVGSFKIGPDYIDPGFHTAATGKPCRNIDLWAMRRNIIESTLAETAKDVNLIIGEGVMGFFDGAAVGGGSTADVAMHTGLPAVLVIDASGQSTSAAAVVHGFHTFHPDLNLGGVIFNRLGGERHRDILIQAMAAVDVPVFGYIPRDDRLLLPDRHLGLVQAREHTLLDEFIEQAAAFITPNVNLTELAKLTTKITLPASTQAVSSVPPLAQRISVAHDEAFAFVYPHVLEAWRHDGAVIKPFSPLADEAPEVGAAIYLPGGYPELHAGRLSANTRFLEGLRSAAKTGVTIYGECGGYMVLGNGLIDANGDRHAMAGLLPLATSFSEPRLQLGYRDVEQTENSSLGERGARFRGHEFHYATTIEEGGQNALFRCRDASGMFVGPAGRREGNVMGSFLHLIDKRD